MKNNMVNGKMREQIMRDQIVKEVATYYVSTQSTIRKTAELFNRSKTWVHRILKIEVSKSCPELEDEVNNVIQINKQARYQRGGLAIKKKYEKLGGVKNVNTKERKIH